MIYNTGVNKAIFLFSIISAMFYFVTFAMSVLAGDRHACDYLTEEEVAQVIEMVISSPERHPHNPLGQSLCFFDAPRESGIRFAQLQLVSSSSSMLKNKGFSAESLFDNNTGFIEGPVAVPGIGEKAFWGGSGMKMGAGLHVYDKDVYFVALAQTGNENDSLAKSRQLAEIVLGKIR